VRRALLAEFRKLDEEKRADKVLSRYPVTGPDAGLAIILVDI
jgi:hypothetical protein